MTTLHEAITACEEQGDTEVTVSLDVLQCWEHAQRTRAGDLTQALVESLPRLEARAKRIELLEGVLRAAEALIEERDAAPRTQAEKELNEAVAQCTEEA